MFLRRCHVVTAALVLLAASMAPGQGKPAPPADDLPAGAVLRLGTTRLRHGGFGLVGLAFLPDEKGLMTASEEAKSLRLWEPTSGQAIREIRADPIAIRGFALSPDGKRLAVSGQLPPTGPGRYPAAATILDVASGKIVANLPRTDEDGGWCAMAFTPDNRFLASLGDNGILRIEDVTNGAEIVQRHFGRIGGRAHLAMSSDGVTLAMNVSTRRNHLLLWNWKTRKEVRELETGEEGFRHFVFSPDGKQLAVSGDRTGKIGIWDVDGGRLLRTMQRPEVKYCRPWRLAYSPDGKRLATTNSGVTQVGKVQLWDPAAGRFVGELDCGNVRGGLLAFSRDSRLLAVDTGNAVRVWDVTSRKELTAQNEAHLGRVNQVVYSSRGHIATAGDDHTARIWDAATGQQIHKLSHGKAVWGVAFSPDGNLLATSSTDDAVHLWDARTGRPLHKLAGHHTFAGCRALRFTPDGKRLHSFGTDFHLRVWDAANGKVIHDHSLEFTGVTLPPKEGPPPRRVFFLMWVQAEFTQDGKTLVTGVPSSFHSFDVATGKETGKFRQDGSRLKSLAVSPEGKRMIASEMGRQITAPSPAGQDQTMTEKIHPVCLWNLADGKLIKRHILPDGIGAGPVAFSPDGKWFATAPNRPEVSIRFWDAASGNELPPITGIPHPIQAMSISPDGKHLAAALRDTSVLVWDLTRKR